VYIVVWLCTVIIAWSLSISKEKRQDVTIITESI